jgi:hypothetical protein
MAAVFHCRKNTIILARDAAKALIRSSKQKASSWFQATRNIAYQFRIVQNVFDGLGAYRYVESIVKILPCV